ncbi:MAG TPA: hypothetical protein EYN27_01660 [Rhodospirillales bacterium]|nr:hypothetical protein [Rhodospirillales bacterium]
MKHQKDNYTCIFTTIDTIEAQIDTIKEQLRTLREGFCNATLPTTSAAEKPQPSETWVDNDSQGEA